MNNLPEEYDRLYKEFPDRWSGKDDRDLFVTKHIDQPKSVIDYGCGNGHTIKRLSKEWEGTKFCGIDFSKIAIYICNKRVPGRFICGTLDTVDEKAEVVLCMGVAEHFFDHNEIGKLKNLLLPGGKLYLEIPNCLQYSDDKEEGFRKRGTQNEWHLNRETWEKILAEQGYNILKSLTGNKPPWEFIWVLSERVDNADL